MKRLLPFLKTIHDTIKHIKESNNIYDSVNLYFQDESRYGLKLRAKRILTCKGVKPLQPYQHKFKNTYLYGAYSPIDGNQFTLDLPYCNTEMMQLYLNQFSQIRPNELKITIMDNAAFHHAKSLTIPKNIIPIFIPPYSPELNPAERVWQFLKDNVCHKIFNSLDDIQDEMCKVIRNKLTPNRIKSLTGYQLYINAF